jgi:hypothetical protein
LLRASTNDGTTFNFEGEVKFLEDNRDFVDDVNDLDGLGGNGDSHASGLGEEGGEGETVDTDEVVLCLLSY